MKKINKFFKKLRKSERTKIFVMLGKALIDEVDDLELKKLKGFKNYYKARSGKIRIVFEKRKNMYLPVNIDYRKGIYKGL